MPDPINQTNITPPRVPLTDERTGLISREWYRFFLNLFKLTGSGTNETSLVDLQLGPPDSQNSVIVPDDFDLKPRDELGTLAAQNADNVRLLGFSTSPSPAVPNPAPTGTIYWDGGTTLGVQMTQNVVQKVGEDQYYYIKASSAISKGQLIMFTGAVGASGLLSGAPATGLTDGQYLMGIAAEDIALNGLGLVASFGLVRGFDASGSPYGEVWNDGDILYYNPAFAGGLTKTLPSAPNVKATVAVVVHNGSGGSGSIFVRVSVGSVLGGTDSNVQFGTLTNKDLIQYDSVAGYWKNVSPSTISSGTATNLAGGAAGSVPYQTGAGATSMLGIGTAAQVLQVNAGATAPEWVASTGTGNVARATSPTFVTPVLGDAAATTLGLNGATVGTGGTGGLNGATLQVYKSGSNAVTLMQADTSGNCIYAGQVYSATGQATAFRGYRLRGTVASPTTVISGDTILIEQGFAYDGTATRGLTQIGHYVETATTTNDISSYLSFQTRPTGVGGAMAERVRINGAGNTGFGTASPVNKVDINGSLGRNAPVTKTASFTLADTENWLICNGTATITVTFPAASSWTGREVMIKTIAAFTVVSASSNVVPLAGGAAGTAILAATAGKYATLVSDGTNWIIMAAN